MTESNAVRDLRSLIHDVKCKEVHFYAITSGEKTFVVRKNDRAYRVGDRMLLRCWRPAEASGPPCYTGPIALVEIVNMIDGEDPNDPYYYGIAKGYCVLGIKLIGGAAASV